MKFNQYKQRLKELLEKWKFELELKWLDRCWHNDPIFRDTRYPPSYYYYYTPEEIRQMEKEDDEREEKEIIRLRALIAEMGRKDREAELRAEVCKTETKFHKIKSSLRKKKK